MHTHTPFPWLTHGLCTEGPNTPSASLASHALSVPRPGPCRLHSRVSWSLSLQPTSPPAKSSHLKDGPSTARSWDLNPPRTEAAVRLHRPRKGGREGAV